MGINLRRKELKPCLKEVREMSRLQLSWTSCRNERVVRLLVYLSAARGARASIHQIPTRLWNIRTLNHAPFALSHGASTDFAASMQYLCGAASVRCARPPYCMFDDPFHLLVGFDRFDNSSAAMKYTRGQSFRVKSIAASRK